MLSGGPSLARATVFFFLELARATVIQLQLSCRSQESFLDFPMKKDLDFSF
jgi:hypothetical protein